MLAPVAFALLLASSANAFFRLPCAKPVLNARIDPIVSLGKASGHGHTIMGGSNIGMSSTFEDMRASDCSTCKVKDDLSAYWIPSLHYEFPNKTYGLVDHGGMLVYYLQRGAANETVEAFPDGLRMVTGDPNVRNNTGSPASKAISWLCLNYANDQGPQTPGIVSTDCPNGMRAQVFFPSCWDGVNLDSPDHSSHMAYPDGIDNGICPPSHPRHLVSIFFEVWFSVDPYNKLGLDGSFVLATGDKTGYSLHGDFLNGWNRDVLSRAVQTCTNLSGVIEDCGVFANEGRFFTDDENNACAAKNPLPNESVSGLQPFLPGCRAVTPGPGPASAADLAPGCTIPGQTTPVASTSSKLSTSTIAKPSTSAVVSKPSSSVITSAVSSSSAKPTTASAVTHIVQTTSVKATPTPSPTSTSLEGCAPPHTVTVTSTVHHYFHDDKRPGRRSHRHQQH